MDKSIQKYIALGSAPYISDYWPVIRESYLKNGYKIIAMNNAWRVCLADCDEWFIAKDFLEPSPNKNFRAGTCIPTLKEMKQLNVKIMPDKVPGYIHKRGGSMILHTLYILLNRAIEADSQLNVVVTGSDLIYSREKKNHFYKGNRKNPIVADLLRKNKPELVGVNADPLRYGDEWIDSELKNVLDLYNKENYGIFVDTPLEETRLPFTNISEELK